MNATTYSLVRLLFVAAAIAATSASTGLGQSSILEQMVNDIVEATTPVNDSPANSIKASPSNSLNEVTLADGTKVWERPDGVVVYSWPDGTKKFVTTDGKKVTLLPNGERLVEMPNQRTQLLPRKSDYEEATRHRPVPELLEPKEDGLRPKRNNEFEMPEKPVREHASWSELRENTTTRRHSVGDHDASESTDGRTLTVDDSEPNVGTSAGGQAKNGQSDTGAGITSRAALPGGIQSYTRDNGVKQFVFPGGTVLQQNPSSSQIIIQKPNGSISYETVGADGSFNATVDGVKSTFTQTGETYFDIRDGERVVIGPDGRFGMSDGNGGTEYRDANGTLLRSEFTDPKTGYLVVKEPDGPMIMQDPQGFIIGIEKRGQNGSTFMDLGEGKTIPVSELLRPDASTKNVAAQGVSGIRTNSPPPPVGYQPPTGPNIFAMMSRQFENLARPRLNVPPPTPSAGRPQKDANASSEADAKSDVLVKRFLESVAAKTRKSELDGELRTAEEQLRTEQEVLNKEMKRTDEEKTKLLLRENREATERRRLNEDITAGDRKKSLIKIRETGIQGEEALVKADEKRIADLVAAALKKVDYSKYRDCPENQPWKECGHGDLKKKWLNAQLAAILGPANVARLEGTSKQRADIERRKKELADEREGIDDAEKKSRERLQAVEQRIAELKQQRNSLSATETRLQGSVTLLQQRIQQLKSESNSLEAKVKSLELESR